MTVLTGLRVVTPGGVCPDGYVRIDGDRIAQIGSGVPGGDRIAQVGTGVPDDAPAGPGGAWLVPGFVDMHTHGGGGHSFTTGEPEAARRAAEFHLRHGTTSLLASLVAAPPDELRRATAALAPLVSAGVLAGVHHEGPYLSRPRCGAQNPAYLREPSIAELSELLAATGGVVRMVTIAPELPGALEAIRLLVSHRVLAAIGHTDATYEQTMAAVAAGATVGTHLFNGMRPPHHRDPGPVLALLGAQSVTCELVADGVHLHDGVLAFAASVAGPGRAALITDAIAAAGMPDGEYELGGQPVTVAAGVARLSGQGAIAGSTLTMDAALRRAVRAGIAVPDAVRMAATTPARVLGLVDVGAIAPGHRADLVVLDEGFRVVRVMRAGRWVR